MELGRYFFIALGLSFLGSLPIGLITLTLIQKTIKNGSRSGILLALGATVMEFMYTYIALLSLSFFSQHTTINHYIKIAATLVFFVMAFYFLFKKTKVLAAPVMSRYPYLDFFQGVAVGAMNMLIVPFWIFLSLWLESQGVIFDRPVMIFIFSLGAAAGALLAFLGYIWLSEVIARKTKEVNRYTDMTVGVLFLFLAFFQLWQLV